MRSRVILQSLFIGNIVLLAVEIVLVSDLVDAAAVGAQELVADATWSDFEEIEVAFKISIVEQTIDFQSSSWWLWLDDDDDFDDGSGGDDDDGTFSILVLNQLVADVPNT